MTVSPTGRPERLGAGRCGGRGFLCPAGRGEGAFLPDDEEFAPPYPGVYVYWLRL